METMGGCRQMGYSTLSLTLRRKAAVRNRMQMMNWSVHCHKYDGLRHRSSACRENGTGCRLNRLKMNCRIRSIRRAVTRSKTGC
jgi:hypothetical protein